MPQHSRPHAPHLLHGDSEMNEVCLPEDLIKEYAAKHPNAPGVTQTQKVFCLAMMMRQDNIEPFEETYRCRSQPYLAGLSGAVAMLVARGSYPMPNPKPMMK